MFAADQGQETLSSLTANRPSSSEGSELTWRWSGGQAALGAPLGSLACVLQVELGPRPAVERAPPVTEEEWAQHVGPEGRLQQVPVLKARIFSGVRHWMGVESWAGLAGGRGEAPLSPCPSLPPRV